MSSDREAVERSALALAQQLGREAIEFGQGERRVVDRKADAFDVVTTVDLAIETHFRERIRNCFPDHAILGEECGLDGEGGEWTWVVDPLDGTFNYVTAFPGTASSIALMRAKETRVGVIADFELDSVFACRRGGGMTCDRESLPTCPGPASELGRARLLIDPGHQVPDPTTFGAIQAFADLAPLVPRLVGSSAVSLAAVALTGGCFVGAGLELWDAVAGVLLAEERGRTVRWWSFAGDSRHHVLAGEPDLVDAFEPAMSGFIRAWCGKSAMFSANRGLNQLLGPSPTILV